MKSFNKNLEKSKLVASFSNWKLRRLIRENEQVNEMKTKIETLTRPVSRRRLAKLAALWDSYSRKQKPLKIENKLTIMKW